MRASRRLGAVASALTVPYVQKRGGVIPVSAEYYGMVLGREFATDAEAARHYFRSGWRDGIVPHPLLDVPAARFSVRAALRLRNQLAALAAGRSHGEALGAPSRMTTRDQLAKVFPAIGPRPDRWFEEVLRHPEKRNAVVVNIGGFRLNWRDFASACRVLTAASATVVEQGLIDERFYSAQVGGATPLSAFAALDDYLANGELDGRAPNPFFEAEWHLHADRVQRRTGRRINQLLAYIAEGEVGQTGPHFWGQRYRAELDSTVTADISPLGHFLRTASDTSLTPAAEGVTPVTVGQVREIAVGRVRDYHSALGRLTATGPVLAQHVDASRVAQVSGVLLVAVDARHLSDAAVTRLREDCERQQDADVTVVVIDDDGALERKVVDLHDTLAAVHVLDRLDGERFGGALRRAIEQHRPDAWTIWTPAQTWEPRFAQRTVSALAAHADVSVVGVVTETTSQPWLRSTDALWLEGLGGAGVAVRGTGPAARLPDTQQDFGVGVMAEILIREASVRCAVVEAPLVTYLAWRSSNYERRAGMNAARARHLIDLSTAPDRTAGVAVVIPTYEDWQFTVRAVRAALDNSSHPDFVVSVVDNGSRRPVSSLIAAVFAGDPRVLVRRMPRNTDFALGSNLGAAAVDSEHVVFLNNDTRVQEGWLSPLLDALDEGAAAAQPLLLYGDRTVQTAGTIFLGGISMPVHLLAGAHTIDVPISVEQYGFSALTAACMAVRRADLRALDGFDPHFVNGLEDVDFCLRLRRRSDAPLRVRTQSHVVHYESKTPGRGKHILDNRELFVARWRHALVDDLDDRRVLDGSDLEITGITWKRHGNGPLREGDIQLRRTPPIVNEAAPRLRWAIKIAATDNIDGDSWGDTYFAADLAAALERLGQTVVIDRRTSFVRPGMDDWDDVTLTLRGLLPFNPLPGAINLLWVISHPDDVTRGELESGFDRVYSAGAIWARRVHERWGIDVRPLLQATNAERFHPGVSRPEARDEILFVGRTRGMPRAIVRDVIAAGATPAVYGDDGWEQFIDARFIRGTLVPNLELPGKYGSARVVLNDHWADMAAHGFFSNRLFDAAAVGARVVSDHVEGLSDVFGEQVQTYQSTDDLRDLLMQDSPRWPTASELRALAARVVQEHSFEARARALLADALDVRAQRLKEPRL